MVFSKHYIRTFACFLLLALCCLPAIFSLFHTGFFVSDDGEWMIIRLSAFYETLKTGQIPVRFIERLHNGYGYPLANFMYPGYLYFGSLVHILGFGFITSVKIIFGGSVVLSAFFTYLWLQKMFPRIPSVIGALFYVYTPYHLFDLYSRGSIGEMLALAILPFILWQIERKDIAFTALGIGLLILSHNSLAFLCMVPLYLYTVLRNKNKKFLYTMFISAAPFILGVLLSAFFWFPALYDLQYTIFKSTVISDWKDYFADIHLVGYSSLLIITLGCISVFTKYGKTAAQKSLFYFFLLLGLFAIFLALPISTILWHSIPSSLIQFPFRILSLLIPSVAFLTAYLLTSQSMRNQIILGGMLVILAVVSSFSFLFPKEFIDRGEAYYISNFSTTTVKDEYMPQWVKKTKPGSVQKLEIVSGQGVIEQQHVPMTSVVAGLTLEKESLIQLNTIYFPGWKVFIDGKEKDIRYDNQYGLIQLTLSPGTYKLEARFTETPIRQVANSISIFAFFVLLFLFIVQVRYNRQSKIL